MMFPRSFRVSHYLGRNVRRMNMRNWQWIDALCGIILAQSIGTSRRLPPKGSTGLCPNLPGISANECRIVTATNYNPLAGAKNRQHCNRDVHHSGFLYADIGRE